MEDFDPATGGGSWGGRPGSGGSATRNKHGALLKGILRCGACDATMTPAYTTKNGRRYRYYRCIDAQQHGRDCPTGWLPAGEIERFVVDRIRSIGTDPELQAAVLARVRGQDGVPDDEAVVGMLREFEPIWDRLSPRKQARVLQLLIERVVYDAREETIELTFRPTALQALTGEETA